MPRVGSAAEAARAAVSCGLLDPLSLVRESAAFVAAQASHVSVDADAVASVAQHWVESGLLRGRPPFDRGLHYVDESEPAATLQYLFVLDALNWCFWPDGDACGAAEPFEYEHLAGGLKRAVEAEPHCLAADRLAGLDGPGLRALLGWPRPLPCEEERARVLRQTAQALARSFGGQAAVLVARAQGSAAALCSLLCAHFPAFRDEAIYRGRQVFFLKRAQIFAADVYAAFEGVGPGAFSDVHRLTMFADYRVPVVLRQLGILRYSADLASAVDSKALLDPGSEVEQEIRGCCIAAVEALRVALEARGGGGAAQLQPGGAPAAAGTTRPLLCIELDWTLWEMGEAARETAPPHHRCLTIWY